MRMDGSLPPFTAKCRAVRENGGFSLTFFCEICGGGYTTPTLICNTPQEALHLGGQDARLHFNRCGCCHCWVCDEHYHEDQMMCTDCTHRRCARCGAAIAKGIDLCAACGAPQFKHSKHAKSSVC